MTSEQYTLSIMLAIIQRQAASINLLYKEFNGALAMLIDSRYDDFIVNEGLREHFSYSALEHHQEISFQLEALENAIKTVLLVKATAP